MVAELKPQPTGRREFADLVAAYVRTGMTAVDAAARVIEDIRNLGLQDALIDALGPEALVHLWRNAGAEQRRQEPKAPRRVIEPVVMPMPASRRRIDLDALKDDASLLEGTYQIDGRWVRIGDMDKSACRAAAKFFKGEALENAQNARYFHALAQALSGGETVRQRFDDDGLMRLWAISGQGA